MFCPYIKGDCREDCAFYVEEVQKNPTNRIIERVIGSCMLAEKTKKELDLDESIKTNIPKLKESKKY